MTVRSITRSRDDITRSLLVLLVCMENIFKELYFLQPQGVSLSIADAKVDTFQLLTKSYYNFFSRKCKEKSQTTDFQILFFLGNFKIYTKIDKYMLQNIKKRTILQ
mgnify:CR=1 FL=1